MAKRKKDGPEQLMVVNDLAHEECRIAILENECLEELYSERADSATSVGNIYKGRVINVEPAIQAAFIDYGEGKNGFLHISDLHPRYFPGEEVKERVGRKIPRKKRPPIQQALKRGDEILVQVIKEGIGTKGPTLTSYLSIPGRLMVMMPDMDNIGVSRKIEDEEMRRRMREVLDSLDLPEGMGFILRTAGFGQTKTELKRDLAYLMRLWKAMEKRKKTEKAPCALYVETDLLTRTIRDVLNPDVEAIIVDSDSAYDRAMQFLSIITPRSAPKVLRYREHPPIFHAFGVEPQIDLIHQREVPLPSGGAIVLEQTEALVAIDVNSGKSRSARDSESNAYHTNCEAVDEICRQLRLRDLGGLIVNDLIDMGSRKNRKAIEDRLHELLKRDRAKTTTLRISEFGIIEMTRQRMRPSIRKSHYQICPTCEGHGEIRSADTIASDAIRHISYLLQFDRVRTVELVCAPRVASLLLSNQRRALVGLEDRAGKRIQVRVSDTIELDQINFFAYDDRSADIDIEKLPAPKAFDWKSLIEDENQKDSGEKKRKSRRGTRGGRRRKKKNAAQSDQQSDHKSDDKSDRSEDKPDAATGTKAQDAEKTDEESSDKAEAASTNGEVKSKSRRRRRSRKGNQTKAETEPDSSSDTSSGDTDGKSPKRKRKRRRKSAASSSSSASDSPSSAEDTSTEADVPGTDGEAPPRKKRRRRSRRKKSAEATRDSKPDTEQAEQSDTKSGAQPSPPPKRKRRTLYRSRTRLGPGQRANADREDDA